MLGKTRIGKQQYLQAKVKGEVRAGLKFNVSTYRDLYLKKLG